MHHLLTRELPQEMVNAITELRRARARGGKGGGNCDFIRFCEVEVYFTLFNAQLHNIVIFVKMLV